MPNIDDTAQPTPCISCGPEPGEKGLTRRSAIVLGVGLAVSAGVGSAFFSSVKAHAAWGGYQNGRIPASALAAIPWNTGRLLRTDARDALAALNSAFRTNFGRDLPINDAYRSYDNQVAAREYWCSRGACANAAVPGTSNHGWALAIDIGVGQRDWGNPIYIWMKNNAPSYGWIHPAWAEPNGGIPEAWHWEFNGTNSSQPPTNPEPENNPNPGSEENDDMANVITVSVPSGTAQIYWSLNLGDNTKARVLNGQQLDFRRNIGIPEYINQPPQILDGYRDIS